MEGDEFRTWDELVPDALGLIFSNLCFHEKLTIIPRVCKGWERVVKGPYCWQEIDIYEWSRNTVPKYRDKMLQMLVNRSGGSPNKLCIYGLIHDHTFSFISDHAKSLQTLRLPESEISDAIVQQMAGKLLNLTYLDLSFCLDIGPSALEAIGRNCKSLCVLRRSMHPALSKPSDDDEALAIAATMPALRCLDISGLAVTTEGVLAIIHNCAALELLDIQGCCAVALEDEVLKTFSGLKIGQLDEIDGDDDKSNDLRSGISGLDDVGMDDLMYFMKIYGWDIGPDERVNWGEVFKIYARCNYLC